MDGAKYEPVIRDLTGQIEALKEQVDECHEDHCDTEDADRHPEDARWRDMAKLDTAKVIVRQPRWNWA